MSSAASIPLPSTPDAAAPDARAGQAVRGEAQTSSADRPASSRRCASVDLDIARRRDGRAGRRERLRQEHPRAAAAAADRATSRARSSSTASISARLGGGALRRFRQRRPDRLPGSVRLARSAHTGAGRSSPKAWATWDSSRASGASADGRGARCWSSFPPTSLDRYPHEFSGGQRQRISHRPGDRGRARGCSSLDEPVSALDVSVQIQDPQPAARPAASSSA